MQVSIDLTEDTKNSHCAESLIIIDRGKEINLRISDNSRVVTVNKKELRKALRILLED